MSRDLIIVAEILRPHGRRGDVVLRPLTDRPETLMGAAHLYLGLDASAPTGVDRIRLHKGAPLLKLTDTDSMDQAHALRGQVLCLPREELAPLEEGEYFLHDLVGLAVVDSSGSPLGPVNWVMDTGGAPVLMIPAPSGGEMMVPFAPGTIEDVDLDAGVIRMAALEGLPIMPGEGSGREDKR